MPHLCPAASKAEAEAHGLPGSRLILLRESVCDALVRLSRHRE